MLFQPDWSRDVERYANVVLPVLLVVFVLRNWLISAAMGALDYVGGLCVAAAGADEKSSLTRPFQRALQRRESGDSGGRVADKSNSKT